MGKPLCAVPAGDWCGEGLVWHPEEQALYWVDINRFLIHRYHPAGGSTRSWFFDEPVTVLALTERPDTLVAALASRTILWKPAGDERHDLGFRLPGWPAVRLNDGGVDPRGSLWLGSMRNNVNPDGSAGDSGGTDGVLYRVDNSATGAVTEWKRDIGIANTFAWSPDGARFYFADTPRNTVWVYDYDKSNGAIANERVFFEGFARGLPDGSAVDSEGYLWNCRHGGGCIVRVAPTGAVDHVFDMPSVNITNCAFGGADYRTLYVTSASLGTPKVDRLAGSVFAMECAVAGQPGNRLRLSQ